MNLKKLILTENECYKVGKKMKVKGIMVHSTGANNPYLKRYVGPDDGELGKNKYNNHWNQYRPSGLQICCHAFIGKLADDIVATYQTLPWDMRGWHGGKGKNGSTNDTHIGFEICEDNLKDVNYFNKVYQEAAELCAYLCKMYNLNPTGDGVIICHKEGYQRGIASNHGDVMHWFPKHGKNMNSFRALVKKLMTASNTSHDKDIISENIEVNRSTSYSDIDVGDILEFSGNKQYLSASASNSRLARASKVKVTRKHTSSSKHPIHVRSIDSKGKFTNLVYGWVNLSDLGLPIIEPYQVKVNIDSLAYKGGPGDNYKVYGYIRDKGIYTIVEEENGYGKLKSKVGWIDLSYTTKR